MKDYKENLYFNLHYLIFLYYSITLLQNFVRSYVYESPPLLPLFFYVVFMQTRMVLLYSLYYLFLSSFFFWVFSSNTAFVHYLLSYQGMLPIHCSQRTLENIPIYFSLRLFRNTNLFPARYQAITCLSMVLGLYTL
jgi:hypothetical protein